MPEERKNKNSAARIAANNRYNGKVYDRINIAIPKCRKAAVEAAAVEAAAKGLISKPSVNGLLNMLLRQYLGFSEAEWKPSPEDSSPAPIAEDAVDVAPEEVEAVEADLPVQDVQESEAVDVEAPAEDVPDVEAVDGEAVQEDVAPEEAENTLEADINAMLNAGQLFGLLKLRFQKGKREVLKQKAEEENISVSEVVIKALRNYFENAEKWSSTLLDTFDYDDETRCEGEEAVEAASVQDVQESTETEDTVTVWLPCVPFCVLTHGEYGQIRLLTALCDYIGGLIHDWL